MRILFVNPVAVVGGGEKVLLTTCKALISANPNLELYLIVCTDGPLVQKAKALGVVVKVLPLPEQLNQLGDSALKGQNKLTSTVVLLAKLLPALAAFVGYLRSFNQLINSISPDLIYSNGIKTHLLLALGNKNIPIIWHLHDFYSTRPLMAKVLKWASKKVSKAIAISKAVAQDAQPILKNVPIEVVYNSLDIDVFSPQETQNHTPVRVGLVATFALWKGQDIFLEAIAEILKLQKDINAHFYIVGEPIYKTKGSQFSKEQLQQKAEQLKITQWVDFLGFQEDVSQIYNWLDIVVHASTQPEPFGLVIAEAMACGKPVIVSQAGGAAELFKDGYDAIGVAPKDTLSLAETILGLVEDPQKRTYLGSNARATAIERFNDQRLAPQLMRIFNLLKNKDD